MLLLAWRDSHVMIAVGIVRSGRASHFNAKVPEALRIMPRDYYTALDFGGSHESTTAVVQGGAPQSY